MREDKGGQVSSSLVVIYMAKAVKALIESLLKSLYLLAEEEKGRGEQEVAAKKA